MKLWCSYIWKAINSTVHQLAMGTLYYSLFTDFLKFWCYLLQQCVQRTFRNNAHLMSNQTILEARKQTTAMNIIFRKKYHMLPSASMSCSQILVHLALSSHTYHEQT